jgi:hypothetical protein
MLPAVIGVTGKKRSGKDEVFRAIAGNGLAGVYRLAFADALKEELAEACRVSVQYIEEHKAQFRLGLQWWGTEFRRGLCSDRYWLDKAEHKFEVLTVCEQPRIVVFTDVRFPNEADLIKALGGKVWRVVRPGILASDPHPSEIAMDGYDCRNILNNGTLDDLRAEVMKALLEDFGTEALCIPH